MCDEEKVYWCLCEGVSLRLIIIPFNSVQIEKCRSNATRMILSSEVIH